MQPLKLASSILRESFLLLRCDSVSASLETKPQDACFAPAPATPVANMGVWLHWEAADVSVVRANVPQIQLGS